MTLSETLPLQIPSLFRLFLGKAQDLKVQSISNLAKVKMSIKGEKIASLQFDDFFNNFRKVEKIRESLFTF